MKTFQQLKIYFLLLGVSAMMGACSTAAFPEITEDEADMVVEDSGEDGTLIGRKSKKIELSMPDEEEGLKSDEKNVAYDSDKPDIPYAAKTKAVKREELSPKADKKQAEKELSESKKKETKPVKTVAKAESKIALPAVDEEENALPSVSYRLDTFYFANGSSALDSKYNKQIRNIVKLAKAKKNAVITVKGYASSRTRNTDPISHKLANFKVSAARAQSVADALKRYGLSASKIQVEALSDTMPAYQEVMPEGERLNRRAEVYIAY